MKKHIFKNCKSRLKHYGLKIRKCDVKFLLDKIRQDIKEEEGQNVYYSHNYTEYEHSLLYRVFEGYKLIKGGKLAILDVSAVDQHKNKHGDHKGNNKLSQPIKSIEHKEI